jgi:hypothetical protein
MRLQERFRQWTYRQRIKHLQMLVSDLRDYETQAHRYLNTLRSEIERSERELQWRQTQIR